MSYRSLNPWSFLVLTSVLSGVILLAGCGLSGSKQLAENESAEIELDAMIADAPADDAPDSERPVTQAPTSAEGLITQRALGRMPDEIEVELPPIPLRRVMPVSSQANLLLRKESPATLPVPVPVASTQAPTSTVAYPLSAQPPIPIAASELGTSAARTVEKVRTVDKIGSRDFQEVVLNADAPVIVDFYADWCGPCKQLAPLLDQVAREKPAVRVVKVNIDHDKALARKYRVRSIPTVMFFRDGELVARHTGLPKIQQALGR